MDLKGKKINFLGDSITEGHGASCPEQGFVSQLERKTGAVCRNYGIGGTRIARQRKPSEDPKHDLDFCSRYAEMDPDADVVAVFGGTNDFGHGDAPFGDFSDRTADSFCGALHLLFSGLIERYPEALIFVMTPLHRLGEEDPRGDGSKTEDGRLLYDYVCAIRRAAEYYSLPVLDLYASSGLQPCVPVIQEKYVPDGLHPNDAGHELLARRIRRFLKQF